MADPYQILGVQQSASPAVLKKAYRKLAKDLHPDLHPGDKQISDRFKEVSAAYDLLSDTKKRARFDRGEIDGQGNERAGPQFAYGRAHAGADHGRPFGAAGGGMGGAFGGAEDVFSQIFSGLRRNRGGNQRVDAKGADRSYSVDIGFLDAARGAKRRLTLADGRTLDVNIPSGIEEGQTIRLRAQGEPGVGRAPAGDALLNVRIVPHPLFTRKHDAVHVEVPITIPEAVLGAKIEVPTIDGSVSMSVPKGSNTGTVLRLKGRGIAIGAAKNRGDQFVRLVVKLPEKPDAELEKFAKDWARKRAYEVRHPSKS